VSREKTSVAFVLTLAGAALVPAVVSLWRHLPPLHEDEILPLVPMFMLRKVQDALGGAFLAGCPRSLGGVPLPLTSYVIEGPLKAIPYAIAYPATRWGYTPERLIAFYRASNVVWTWALFAAVLGACVQLGGRRAAWLCAGLLVSDVALVYLGLTDLGRPLHLMMGIALAAAIAAHVERPRWRGALVIALVVWLGEWDRADFLWFMGAGLAGAVSACVVVPARRWGVVVGPVMVGYVVGLAATAAIVPQYFRLAAEGGGHLIPLTDVVKLRDHLSALLHGIDPLGSFQRSFDVGAHDADTPYVLYRQAYAALIVVASAGLALLGIRTRRPALLVFAACPVALLGAVVVTAESYLVHHVLVMKPFLYVALAVLIAAIPWRAPALAVWLVLVIASAAVQMRAFVDVTRGPTATGIYGVTWNQSDAWAAGARADVPVVVAVDFGAWVPGALASPPTQRWESSGIPDDATLDNLMAGQTRVGLVIRTNGPNAWVLDQQRYPVVAHETFTRHPGDPWAFLALAARR
jgi:hypothetical protein